MGTQAVMMVAGPESRQQRLDQVSRTSGAVDFGFYLNVKATKGFKELFRR